MTWSFPIARLLGSEVRIHVTFLLLLAWIGVARYLEGGTAAAVQGVVFSLLIFACVLAHEFGHAIAARRYGIRTPDITLLPIGGVARLERMPEKPGEEIVVALAGPAVNVVIAAVLLLLGARMDMASLAALENPAASMLGQLAAINLFLVVFNLVPAFPMDGGRVLRALLALRRGPAQATRITARVGANRRDRFTARLPMLRRPHPEGGVGAVRVEVRGRRGQGRDVTVLGAMDRPGVAAGSVAAVAALWIGESLAGGPGARGLAGAVAPVPFLAELARRGVKAAAFEGTGAARLAT